MVVKIRLKRTGKKKQPSYRVVVADSRSPRDGRIIESIGRYDPRQDPSVVEIDNERAQYWLGNGAQPTERAQKLLEISGAVEAKARSGVYHLETSDPGSTPAPKTEASKPSTPVEAPVEEVVPAPDREAVDDAPVTAEPAVEEATETEEADAEDES